MIGSDYCVLSGIDSKYDISYVYTAQKTVPKNTGFFGKNDGKGRFMYSMTCDECAREIKRGEYRAKVDVLGPLCDDITTHLHFHQGRCFRRWKRKFQAFLKEASARVEVNILET